MRSFGSCSCFRCSSSSSSSRGSSGGSSGGCSGGSNGGASARGNSGAFNGHGAPNTLVGGGAGLFFVSQRFCGQGYAVLGERKRDSVRGRVKESEREV